MCSIQSVTSCPSGRAKRVPLAVGVKAACGCFSKIDDTAVEEGLSLFPAGPRGRTEWRRYA